VTNEKLGTGAVTGKKIAKKAVSPRTIASNAVGTEAIANEAVTIGKIGKEAVDASKISTSLWAQLVRNVAYINSASFTNDEPNKSVTAECPKGKEAIGGGVRLEGELKEVAVTGSYPFATGTSRTGWTWDRARERRRPLRRLVDLRLRSLRRTLTGQTPVRATA
jgi:hypothetical protein